LGEKGNAKKGGIFHPQTGKMAYSLMEEMMGGNTCRPSVKIEFKGEGIGERAIKKRKAVFNGSGERGSFSKGGESWSIEAKRRQTTNNLGGRTQGRRGTC